MLRNRLASAIAEEVAATGKVVRARMKMSLQLIF
jgi:hypothetical protein